jgi:hypothetical protein
MTLAELIIKLSADTAVLRTDFEKGKQYAQSFAGDLSKIFSTIGTTLPGLSAGAIAKELLDLAESTAKVGEQIHRMGDITGLSAEDLSGLRAISEESGESFDSLATTLARAGKNIEEGFINPAGTAGKLLAALFTPAELAALKLEPVSKRLEDVTKKIFGLTDASERDFAAATLFGRGWTENVETLKKLGTEGLDMADKKASIFGITMSEDDVAAAHAFSEALKGVGMVAEGVMEKVGHGLISAFTAPFQVIDRLQDQIDSLEKNHGIVLADVWKGADTGVNLGPMLGLNVKGAHKSLADLMSGGGGAGGGKATDAQWKEYQESLEGWLRVDKEYLAALEQSEELTRDWGPVLNPVQKAWDDYAQRLQKINVLMYQGIDGTPMLAASLGRLNSDLAGANPGGISWGNMGMQRQDEAMNDPLKYTLGQSLPALKQVHDQFAVLDADAFEFGERASNDFTKLIIAGKGFQQALRGLVDLLAQFLVKLAVFDSLSKLFSQGNNPQGVIGSLFAGLAHMGGARASGGDVNYGQSYLVGEQGPEIFTPTTSGMIVPNGAMNSLGGGGGRGGDTYHIDARGADAGVEYRIQRAIAQAKKDGAVNGYLMTQEMGKRGA